MSVEIEATWFFDSNPALEINDETFTYGKLLQSSLNIAHVLQQHKNVSDWDINDVILWFSLSNFKEYIQIIQYNNIDGKELIKLNREKLLRLDISYTDAIIKILSLQK